MMGNEKSTKVTKMDKIRWHIQEHKEAYIVGGIGVGAVITTYLVMKGSVPSISGSSDCALSNASNTAVVQWKPSNIVTTVLIRRDGTLGQPVRCIETGEVFGSISRAADLMGISRPNLSSHLHGRLPAVSGYTFETLDV